MTGTDGTGTQEKKKDAAKQVKEYKEAEHWKQGGWYRVLRRGTGQVLRSQLVAKGTSKADVAADKAAELGE
jgi:hypothetical protein